MYIYSIFKSLAINDHFFIKYVNFIIACQNRVSDETYFESHHIIPKSIMPEYADLSIHTWNAIDLTAREHIIAHILLHFAFGGKLSVALHCMLGNFNSETNKLLNYRNATIFHKSRFLASARIESAKYKSEIRIGKSVYKDENGNKYFLDTNDSLIEELNLVGNNANIKFTDEQKENLKRSKDENRVVLLYFMTNIVKLSKKYNNIHLIEQYISQGWSFSKTEDDYIDNKNNADIKISESLKGRLYCYDENDNFLGRFYKDDEIWNNPNYKNYIKTEARVEQLKDFCEKAREFNTGTKVYNNGVIAIKFKDGDVIPEGFFKGALPRPSTQGRESKRKLVIEKSELIKAFDDLHTKGAVAKHFKISLPTLNRIMKVHDYTKTKKALN